MKNAYQGCFVTLAVDILQYGKISKTGTNGIITNIENGTLEVITEENRYTYCKTSELRKMRLMSYDEALITLKEYCGHHCKNSDQFQFNIKFYHYRIPDIVSELCRDDAIWDRYYEILNDSLDNFINQNCDYGLNCIIPWLGTKARSDWWQAGRSGGWLVVKCDTDYESSVESIDFARQQMSDLWDLYDATEEGEDKTDLVKEFKSLAAFVKATKHDIRVLASQLEFVSKLIEVEKRSLGQYISAMEPWKELVTRVILEDCQEEFKGFEEKEELVMSEIEPTETAFEQEINTARQQTEGYCNKAYRLLQMNSNSYSLLVSWEDRVNEAIRERKALLKSARKLLAQLEEDTDTFKLLQNEITVRLNRKEQEVAA